MKDLIVVKVEDLHQCLTDWIKKNRVVIGDYEDMKDMVLNMIRAGHCFSMDRDRLRDAMEDIAFMMNAEDDALKDRVLRSLEYEDEDSDEEDVNGYEEFVRSQMGQLQKGQKGQQDQQDPGCKHAVEKTDASTEAEVETKETVEETITATAGATEEATDDKTEEETEEATESTQ